MDFVDMTYENKLTRISNC